MATKRKSIIEEALLDAKSLEDALKANTKEMLSAHMSKEIESIVESSLKEQDEETAMGKICELLPKEKGNEYLQLFHEYENQETKESEIVKALDKLLPMMQSIALENHMDSAFRQINVNENQVQEYVEKYFTNIEYLYPYFKEIFVKAIEKKIFAES